MVFGIEPTPVADKLPRRGDRVLGWSGTGKRYRWKPVTYTVSATTPEGFYLDCGTGPVAVTHWCALPPNPND